MATVTQILEHNSFFLRASAGAAFYQADGTAIPVAGWAFDASADEEVWARLKAQGYGSGNVTVTVWWYAANATSGDVVWGAALAAITPDTDSQDIEGDSLATENTATDSHLGTTSKRLQSVAITVSNLDSLASGDDVALRVRRVGSSGSDTMSNDAILTRVEVSYSDA